MKKASVKTEKEVTNLDFLEQFAQMKSSDLPSKDTYNFWKNANSPDLKYFQSNEQTGKWCLFFSADKIDDAWKKIEKACKEKQFILCKCSTAATSGTSRYPNFLICVYTSDWSNAEDVKDVREKLHKLGFTQPLKYKRDLETSNKVYNTEDEYYIIE